MEPSRRRRRGRVRSNSRELRAHARLVGRVVRRTRRRLRSTFEAPTIRCGARCRLVALAGTMAPEPHSHAKSSRARLRLVAIALCRGMLMVRRVRSRRGCGLQGVGALSEERVLSHGGRASPRTTAGGERVPGAARIQQTECRGHQRRSRPRSDRRGVRALSATFRFEPPVDVGGTAGGSPAHSS
jgi:hypothetical protein